MAKTFAKGPRPWQLDYQGLPTLGDKKTKILIYYDSYAKPGDTGDEVPASYSWGEYIASSRNFQIIRDTWLLPM